MDNIVSMEFMLYGGTNDTAMECSDLLWAAKGAAASCGIVLSMTAKTFKPVNNRYNRFIHVNHRYTITSLRLFIALLLSVTSV